MNQYLIPDDDIELDLIDLLHYFIKHTLQILLVGTAVGCFIGGYKGISAARMTGNQAIYANTEKEEQEYQQESELYKDALTGYKTNIGQSNDYLKNSTLMQLNPYRVQTANSTLIITTDTSDTSLASLLAQKYKDRLLTGDYLDNISQSAGVGDISLLSELIDVTANPLTGVTHSNLNSQSDLLVGVENTSTVENIDSEDSNTKSKQVVRWMVSLTAIGKDQEQADTILTGMLGEADKIYEELSKKYQFNFEKGSVYNYTNYNKNVQSIQNNFYNNMEWLYTRQQNAKGYQKSLIAPLKPVSVEKHIDKKLVIKFGFIGFVLGAFLMLLYYFIKYIKNDKLVSYTDLSRRFKLRELGIFDQSDSSVNMIAANLCNYVPESGKIMLVGTAPIDFLKRLQEQIKKVNNSVDILLAGNILEDADARHALTETDTVVLVEKKNISKYSDIKSETEVLGNSNKTIAGIVIC